jgi:hypothetical protein
MDWNIFNSSNEKGVLKSNGPYRIPTTDKSARSDSRLDGATKPQTLGDVKVYGTPVGDRKPGDHKTYNIPDGKKS